jgi:hypothetical protein
LPTKLFAIQAGRPPPRLVPSHGLISNLSIHLCKLEEAAYITIDKRLYGDSALSAEVAHEGGFVGEDFPAKPVFEGVVHGGHDSALLEGDKGLF